VTTNARMMYDDEHLYVAFRCDEPDIEHVHPKTADDPTGKFHEEVFPGPGDLVEIAIADDEKATTYHHIRISIVNGRWDALTKAGVEVYGKDSTWTGDYKNAVVKAADHWSVEVAIPWKTLGRKAPKAGEKIKGNLIRRTNRRFNTREMEFASWSQSRKNRYVEAKHFGTWVFE